MELASHQVGERFELVRELGRGGMGVVFEAYDHERGEAVALKMLSDRNAEHLLRLKREFRALTDLSHPNLVALYDLFVDAELSFFTMELVDGVDLISYCAGDQDRLRRVLPQVARAIAALHDANVIHRDIKPTNILVTPAGRAVLLDFGVSAEITPGARDPSFGDVVGTVDYMSPEQGAGERPTFAADWYSFGVTLFHALTGRLPYEGSPMNVLLDKVQRDAPPVESLAPNAPADLAALAGDLLARSPRDRPDGREVLRRIGVPVAVAADRSSVVSSPFVGRHAELSALEARCTGIVDGALVLVEGESGIGKTALVGELLLRLRGRYPEMVVLHGRCYELESVAYKALDSLVDDLSGYWRGLPSEQAQALLPDNPALLTRLFPVLGRVPAISDADRGEPAGEPRELRQRGVAALRSTLSQLAARQLVVLWIEDMHWVDTDSVQMLEDLLRPPDAPRLVVVATARPRDLAPDDPLEQLVAALPDRSQRITLGPLPYSESLQLARSLLPGEQVAAATDVASEAAGNPLFIAQLTSYLQTVETTGVQRIGLDEVLTARLRRLSDRALRTLQTLGLASEPMPREVLGRALDLPFDELAADLRLLRIARMIESGGSRRSDYVRPYHDRVTRAVLAGISEDHLATLHRRLAVALEEWNEASPERLSRHWQGAGNRGKAATYALRAAHEATARLDFERGAALFQLAIELGIGDPSVARQLEILRGEALVNAGRPKDAAAAFARAASSADPAAGLELKRRAAEQLLAGGYIARGLGAIGPVLDELGAPLADSPGRARRTLVWQRVRLRLRGLRYRPRPASDIPPAELIRIDAFSTVATGLGMVDTQRGAAYAARMLRAALRAGEPNRIARALALEIGLVAALGRERRADRVAALAEQAATAAGSRYAAGLVRVMRGLGDYLACRWRQALDDLAEAEALLFEQREETAFWAIDQAQLFGSLALLNLGELGELRERTARYLRDADRHGDRYLSTCLRTRLGLAHLAAGDPDRAAGESEAAIRDWSRGHDQYHLQHYYARHTRGELALYTGRLDRVDEILGETASLREVGLDRVALIRIEDAFLRGRLLVARALSRPAASSDARPHLRTARALARELARQQTTPLGPACGAALAGVVALELGDRDRAMAELRRAADGFAALDAAPYLAATRQLLGALIGGDEGRALAADANRWMVANQVRDPERFGSCLVPRRRSAR